MHYHYKTKGTCSIYIDFDIEDNIIHNVVFTSGCSGNLKAISKLVEGMQADKVSALLRGNTCGHKQTSCADQLAIALDEALSQAK